MIRPILACADPYGAAERLRRAGWEIDFSQPPESGDPLVGVSLCGNALLLGVTEGYVPEEHRPYIGCGVELYLTVPRHRLPQIHAAHSGLDPTELAVQPWGDLAFQFAVEGFRLTIAAPQEEPAKLRQRQIDGAV